MRDCAHEVIVGRYRTNPSSGRSDGRHGYGSGIGRAIAAGLIEDGYRVIVAAVELGVTDVVGLSDALRAEAHHHGVGVTVVCPSAVDTPILDKGKVGTPRDSL